MFCEGFTRKDLGAVWSWHLAGRLRWNPFPIHQRRI